jgi:hypothetical protein
MGSEHQALHAAAEEEEEERGEESSHGRLHPRVRCCPRSGCVQAYAIPDAAISGRKGEEGALEMMMRRGAGHSVSTRRHVCAQLHGRVAVYRSDRACPGTAVCLAPCARPVTELSLVIGPGRFP